MKFNLKLFVLVGVLAGIIVVILFGGRGVKPVEKNDGEVDDSVEEETFGDEDAAPTPKEKNAVIKAVYKTEADGDVKIMNGGFKNKLDHILVKKVNGVAPEEQSAADIRQNADGDLVYSMEPNVEYEVLFVFKKEAAMDSVAFMFVRCSKLTSIDMKNFVVQNVTDMSSMFLKCCALQEVSFGHFDSSRVTDMSDMFLDCSSLSKVYFGNFNTQSVKSMPNMFSKCSSLSELNLSNFDTSNVTNMSCMFYECQSLKKLNLSSFNTSNVEDMSWMFGYCSSLKGLNLSTFNTEKVENMSFMFYACSSLEKLNLSSFNTINVENMSCMFYECSALKELDLYNFNTSKVTNMADMFDLCTSLNLVFLPLKDVDIKKRCICCVYGPVLWNNHEVGGLNPNIVQLKKSE